MPGPTYPPKVQEFARRLAKDGRSINQIREALAKRGYSPKRDTVRYWVDDDHREEKLRLQRRFRPPGSAARKGWRRRLERMEALREVGLSFGGIAAVMTLDFEDLELDAERARRILTGRVQSKTMRRLLAPQEASGS